MAATPAELFSTNETEPRWSSRMAAISGAPTRPVTSPRTKSCPTRCLSDMPPKTRSAHEGLGLGAVVVGMEDEEGPRLGSADGRTLGAAFVAHAEQANSTANTVAPTLAVPRIAAPWSQARRHSGAPFRTPARFPPELTGPPPDPTGTEVGP